MIDGLLILLGLLGLAYTAVALADAYLDRQAEEPPPDGPRRNGDDVEL